MSYFLKIAFLLLLVNCNGINYKTNAFLSNQFNKGGRLVDVRSKNNLEVKIAVFVPLSGKYQEWGQSIIDSIELALYQLNANHITYKAIDTGNDAASTRKAMKNINFDDIDIILGPIQKEQAKEIYIKAKKNKILMIVYSRDLELMNMEGLYILDIVPYQQVKRILQYANDKLYYNIYAVAQKNKYSDVVKKAISGKIKSILLYTPINKPSAKRFTIGEAILGIKASIKKDALDQILGFSTPAILLPEQNNNLINVINQLLFFHSISDLKYKILGIGDWRQYSMPYHIINSKSWISDIPYDALSIFYTYFYNNYKYTPPRIASIAYDSIMLIASLTKQTNDQVIIKFGELEKSEGYHGTNGLFRFRSNGINERLFSVYEYEKGIMKEIDKAYCKFSMSN